MNRAALYQRSNGLQRRDAKLVLDNFAQCLQWRPDGHDSLLDIGCGSGDVTIDFILPTMPRNFSRLVGVDLSEQMICHARDQYPHTKISFDNMDIGDDIDKYLVNLEPFDHVTSFYCLHWVQNQKKVMQNIYRLLQPDGDCLLAFLANNPIFEVYIRMARNPKWSAYMYDVNSYISPYQYSKAPAEEFRSLLYATGFTEYSVEVREQLYIFEGVDILKSKFTFQFKSVVNI